MLRGGIQPTYGNFSEKIKIKQSLFRNIVFNFSDSFIAKASDTDTIERTIDHAEVISASEYYFLDR